MKTRPMRGDDLTQQDVQRLFTYHQDGYLVWNARPVTDFVDARACKSWNAQCSNKRAGGKTDQGYRRVAVNGRSYKEHRLIWLYHWGTYPNKQIDHIDHNRSNNRIENLRCVSHQENKRNSPKRANNTSGVTGVYWNKSSNRWMAYICVDGKQSSLGLFEDKADAVAARSAASVQHGYHENHGVA